MSTETPLAWPQYPPDLCFAPPGLLNPLCLPGSAGAPACHQGDYEGCPGCHPHSMSPPPARYSGMVRTMKQAPKSDISLLSLLGGPQRTKRSARWSSPTGCVNGSSSSSSAAVRASWPGRGSGPCGPSGRLSTCLQTVGQSPFRGGALPDSFTPQEPGPSAASRGTQIRRWASRSSSSQTHWLAALFWQIPPGNPVDSGHPQLQLPSSLWDHKFTEASRPKQTVKTLGLTHRSSPSFPQLRSQPQPPGPAHRTWLSPRVTTGHMARLLIACCKAGWWGVVWSTCR